MNWSQSVALSHILPQTFTTKHTDDMPGTKIFYYKNTSWLYAKRLFVYYRYSIPLTSITNISATIVSCLKELNAHSNQRYETEASQYNFSIKNTWFVVQSAWLHFYYFYKTILTDLLN